MTKLNLLVSLITKDNDFQMEQAAAADDAAAAEVQAVLDQFVRANKWHKRQQPQKPPGGWM